MSGVTESFSLSGALYALLTLYRWASVIDMFPRQDAAEAAQPSQQGRAILGTSLIQQLQQVGLSQRLLTLATQTTQQLEALHAQNSSQCSSAAHHASSAAATAGTGSARHGAGRSCSSSSRGYGSRGRGSNSRGKNSGGSDSDSSHKVLQVVRVLQLTRDLLQPLATVIKFGLVADCYGLLSGPTAAVASMNLALAAFRHADFVLQRAHLQQRTVLQLIMQEGGDDPHCSGIRLATVAGMALY
jgi:hypothetical protein